MIRVQSRLKLACTAAALLLGSGPLAAQSNPQVSYAPAPTYADLADLADSAALVIRAQIRGTTRIEPERARGVAPGKGRFFVEARTEALISGANAIGEQLRFLADLPLDAKGKPPKLKKRSLILFARAVPGRPGELQLTAPDAFVAWDPAIDTQLRAILAGLLGGAAPPRVSGVREAIYVPGNLAGEGETQVFLATPSGEPAALTITSRPGQRPVWSASFSEVLNANAPPPRSGTLEWYRLACFLPRTLPPASHVSAGPAERENAARDYAMVIADLGTCPRTRR